MSQFLPEMQAVQYVAEVKSALGQFRVFRTGSARHYLFDQLGPDGCSTGLQFPVLKADLRPGVRQALAHGCGNA